MQDKEQARCSARYIADMLIDLLRSVGRDITVGAVSGGASDADSEAPPFALHPPMLPGADAHKCVHAS